MKLLKSKWMAPILGLLLYFGCLVVLWKPPPPEPVKPAADAPAGEGDVHLPNARPVLTGPSWNFYNPEMDQLISELQKEKAELAKKRQLLDELTVRMQTERLELNQVTQVVQRLRMDMDQLISRVQEEETANLKKLAKIYSTMTPEAALPILQELDDGVLVKIMLFMKDAQTAPILEGLAKLGEAQARRAATLSERIRLSVFRNETEKPKS
jgi:flagellar motility protein MotE (MotC chaperone)